MSLHATFAFTFDINPSSSKFHFSFQQICKSGCHTNKQTSWKSLRMFFFCWTAAQQVVERGSPDHHTPHHSPDHIQETDRCVCPAILRRQCSWISVRQFSLFLNGLEYHQPFFTFFAATLKCIEKRPNLAVLWSHRIYNAWNIISGNHCRCLLGIQGALRDLEPVVVDMWSHCLVVHYQCSTIFNK